MSDATQDDEAAVRAAPAAGIRTVVRSDRSDNEVFLRGRLAELPAQRELPSGDVLASFRLTVDRPVAARAGRDGARTTKIDSIDCIAVVPRVRAKLDRLSAGALIEVQGSLRRRFWRSPSGPQSRYAVEVVTVRAVHNPR